MGSAPKRTASKVGAQPARPAVRIARPYAEVILEYLSRQRCWRDRARAAPAREVFQNRSCAINAPSEQSCATLCHSTGSTVGHPRVTIFYHQTHGKPTLPLHSGPADGASPQVGYPPALARPARRSSSSRFVPILSFISSVCAFAPRYQTLWLPLGAPDGEFPRWQTG